MSLNFEGLASRSGVPLSGATPVVSQSIAGGQDLGTAFILSNGSASVKVYLPSNTEATTIQLWIQTRTGSDWETQVTIDTGVVPTNY